MFTYFVFILACVVATISTPMFIICLVNENRWNASNLKGLAKAAGKEVVFYTKRWFVIMVISTPFVIAYLTY